MMMITSRLCLFGKMPPHWAWLKKMMSVYSISLSKSFRSPSFWLQLLSMVLIKYLKHAIDIIDYCCMLLFCSYCVCVCACVRVSETENMTCCVYRNGKPHQNTCPEPVGVCYPCATIYINTLKLKWVELVFPSLGSNVCTWTSMQGEPSQDQNQ